MAKHPSMMRAWFALLLLTLTLPTFALAQSKKYPPEPIDKDVEEETRSELWESALNPELRPYTELVRAAESLLQKQTNEDTKLAIEKLGEAIAKLPNEPQAYFVRGRLYLSKRDWPKCADDLGAAEDHSKDPDLTSRTRLRIDLGVCQARANRLADAERTLVRAASHAPTYRGELGLRLGETRIALGKLDEAIDALTAALEFTDIQHHLTRWLLTAAYDRARRPTEATEQADLARKMDPQRTYIEAPPLQHLGVGDTQYLLGVAYRYATPKPEYALLYFRLFVKAAPESPWRRRAEEHVRDLSNLRFPAKETITTTGSATTTTDDMRAALEKSMKSMRHCLAGFPTSAFQVTITKVGPVTAMQARDRPIYRVPTPSIRVSQVLNIQNPADTVGYSSVTAGECIEKEANKVKMPAPKEKDSYYMMSFLVIAP
jgi:tetratricopeptide (TPR) repeat protein